jgi:hypothetical protein
MDAGDTDYRDIIGGLRLEQAAERIKGRCSKRRMTRFPNEKYLPQDTSPATQYHNPGIRLFGLPVLFCGQFK